MNRKSNFELLRIVAMFFIVLWHVILNSGIWSNSVGITGLIFKAIMLVIVFHVNAFMLMTGYFQYESKFKLNKLVSLLFEIGFYNLLINSVLYFSGLVDYSIAEYIKSIFFLNFTSYWYIQSYVIIYILSPFINKFIDTIEKKSYKQLLAAIFVLFGILPYISFGLFNYTNSLNVDHYLFMYLLGAYLKKYQILENAFSKYSLYQKRLIYIVTFISCFLLNFSLHYLGIYMATLNSGVLTNISKCLLLSSTVYSNPIIIIQSLSVFFLFSSFNIKNKFINFIASLTLAVYIIHDNLYIRTNLFKWLKLDTGTYITNNYFILKVFIVSILIFMISSSIEILRNLSIKALKRVKIINKFDNHILKIISSIINVN